MEKPDLFKTASGGSGYSSLDIEKVVRFLGLDIRFFGSNTKNPPKEEDVDDKYLDILSQDLQITYESIGVPTVGNESTKCEFISPFMKVAVASLKTRKISLKKEYVIKGEFVGGPVEYVVREGNKILLVVEAKKDDWGQGRAQLLMEMYEAYQLNMKNNTLFSDYKMYGAVCNGDMWEFISYSKDDKWKYYGTFRPFPRNLDSDVAEYRNACKEVLFILRAMIKDSAKELLSDTD